MYNKKVALIGIGGAGKNFLDRASQINEGQQFGKYLLESIFAKTIDKLDETPYDKVCYYRADGDFYTKESAEAINSICDEMDNYDTVIVEKGLGSDRDIILQLVVKKLMDMGITPIVVASLPFRFEGKTRNDKARAEAQKLRELMKDALIFDNEILKREVPGNTSIGNAMFIMDKAIWMSIADYVSGNNRKTMSDYIREVRSNNEK